MQFRDLLEIQRGQPVNGKGDTGTGQTDHQDLQDWRLGHCPATPCQVYHRGTLRFPPRIPLRRLRLWKINVRTPVPAHRRPHGWQNRGTASTAHAAFQGEPSRPGKAWNAWHGTCTLCGLSCGQTSVITDQAR